jgi:hypothetical protein
MLLFDAALRKDTLKFQNALLVPQLLFAVLMDIQDATNISANDSQTLLEDSQTLAESKRRPVERLPDN